jgi:two-component system, NarL family, sensor kinase
MHLIRHPVAQFLAIGTLVLAGIVVGTGLLAEEAATAEATADARATTEVLARSVAEPAVPPGLVTGDAGALDRFDRTALDRLLVGEVLRIKIWRRDGTIVYSDQTSLIGDRYRLGADELAILEHGGSDAEVSDLDREENRFERGSGGLVEVYTRIRSPEREPLLFEVYYSASDIEARSEQVVAPFRRITVGALAVLVAAATVMLWLLTRRLTVAAADRERLLRSAVAASEGERRRIARDLHDTVVQDLAGTAFSLTALAREDGDGTRRRTLDEAGASLRDSLRDLRSLLVEIHPPDLRAEDLEAALSDLTAPAAATGATTAVRVSGVEGLPQHVVALVWRVAQEAVRNVTRHADADSLTVSVRREPGTVVLEVLDDGTGFRPDERPADTSFGLRGLASLVDEHGGRLEVRSMPGQGTTVRLEVGDT